jgi:hypothetical protein
MTAPYSTIANPHQIRAAEDLHHSPPPIDYPTWSENSLYEGYDPDQGIFFYHHMGRVPEDTRYWCGDFVICLPDCKIYTSKTFGSTETSSSISTNSLTFDCLEPMHRWRVRYEGIAHRTTQALNKTQFQSVDEPCEIVEFDILWNAVSPMCRMGRPREGSITTSFDVHYEQVGQFRGHFRHGDTRIPLSGYSYKDHSVGGRDIGKVQGHSWFHGQFPESGRSFGLFHIKERAGADWVQAFYVEDGQLYDCEVSSYPRWLTGADFEGPVELVLKTPVGTRHITGEMLQPGYYWTLIEPSQLCVGFDPVRAKAEDMLGCKEAATRYLLDGETGYGLTEISHRHGSG